MNLVMNKKKIFLVNIGDKRKGAKYNMETNKPVKNEEINIIKRAVKPKFYYSYFYLSYF